MTALVLIVVLIGLFLLGVPVAYALGITSIALMLVEGTLRMASIPQTMTAGVNSFTILAVPLFLLAGKLMNTGGITVRLIRFARTIIGFLPGSLGHVNVVTSVIFAGMSGTAVADASGVGPIMMKAMREAKFDDEFSASVTAASSTIGPIIPPSLPMVIYGMMASVSVGALFVGGILPGLLMATTLMLVVAYYAWKRGYPRDPFPTAREFWDALKGGILPLLTPLIIVGGIYSGLFTPTEAAVVAVVYAGFLSGVIYRELTWASVLQTLRETVRDSAVIGLILTTATLYGNVIVRAQVPQMVLSEVTGAIQSPWVMLLVLNLFLLVVGAFMETTSAITILMPVLMPLLEATGINPLHFGIVMILNLMIGVLTPPFGIVLFVMARVSGLPITRLTRYLLPWIAALLIALALVTFIPQITLWLPRLLGL